MSRLEIPIFGPDSGAEAARAGAHRLELNRAGSYGVFTRLRSHLTPPTPVSPSLPDSLSQLTDQLAHRSYCTIRRTTLSLPVLIGTLAAQHPNTPSFAFPINAFLSIAVGGTTPTLTELTELTSLLSHPAVLPIRIMIRPRGAPVQSPDFIYTPAEIAQMRDSIIKFKTSGLLVPERGDGFVFGLLKLSGPGHNKPTPRSDDNPPLHTKAVGMDMQQNQELVQLARPYPCVFHRAFDDLLACTSAHDRVGIERAVEDVIACGFNGVLTSGGPGIASDPENMERLERVVRFARGKVEVIAGGGVRSRNIGVLVEGVGRGGWFHSSCLVGGRFDEDEAGRLVQELSLSNERAA